MIELGQLEKKHDEFAKRNVRVIAISMEEPSEAAQTQTQFPHLTILADSGRGMSEALAFVHAKTRPDGGDADAPTTIIVDRSGTVRWFFRPTQVIARLSPDEVLKAVDATLDGK